MKRHKTNPFLTGKKYVKPSKDSIISRGNKIVDVDGRPIDASKVHWVKEPKTGEKVKEKTGKKEKQRVFCLPEQPRKQKVFYL